MSADTIDPARLAQLLIGQAPDAVLFADRDGIIRVWNASAERIFGFAQHQAVGASLDIIIPEALRDAHWRGFARACNDGVTQYAGKLLPTKALRADGTLIYVELGFAIVTDANGVVLGASAHARDITARFEQERATRKRLQQLESMARH